MIDSPPAGSLEQLQGTAKAIATLVGAAGLFKLTALIVVKLWERWIKQDDYRHQAHERSELFAREQFKEEKATTRELRNENQILRERLFAEQTENARLELKVQQFEEDNAELVVENERLREILKRKFNQPPPEITE